MARFNFSHGTHEEQKARLDKLKALRDEMQRPVAALLDTKGPEIRLRDFKDGRAQLKKGQYFTLTTRELDGDETITLDRVLKSFRRTSSPATPSFWTTA